MDTYYIWLHLRECISPLGHVNHANIWKCDISSDICLTKVMVWQLNEFPREIKNSKNAKYFMLQSSPWKAVYCYQSSRTRPKGLKFHCFYCACHRCVISINSNPHGWRKPWKEKECGGCRVWDNSYFSADILRGFFPKLLLRYILKQ